MKYYEDVETVSSDRIVRNPAGNLYVSWYDAACRQQRRRSLSTRSVSVACAIVQGLVDRGVSGDPRDALACPRVQTVRDVLECHRKYVGTLASAETETISIAAICRSALADRRLASLTSEDFENLVADWQAEGASIGTASRRLSTLRSAVRKARRKRQITPHEVPEI